MQMEVVKAQDKDISELVQLNDYVRKYPGHQTKFVDPGWIKDRLDNYYVVRDSKGIAAASCVTVHVDHSKLDVLSVRSDCRRKGIGKTLVNHAAALSKQAGVSVLRVGSQKRFDAYDFYSKCGFAFDSVRSTETNDEFEMVLRD